MSIGSLILCERSHQWTVAMRSALAEADVRIRTASSLSECQELLERARASVVGLGVDAIGVERTMTVLSELRQSFPQTHVIVLGSREMEHVAPWYYEAGALHVACSLRNPSAVGRLIIRALKMPQQPARTLREAVWQRLPWPAAATARN